LDSQKYNDYTYGGYDMLYTHGDDDPHLFLGSGGGKDTKDSDETRGGGIITMKAALYEIYG
jgi:hypothetical protein